VDSELNFEWPGASAGTLPDVPAFLERRPLSRNKSARRPQPHMHAHLGGQDLCQLLEAAEATITQLEADRRTARKRIEELEAAEDAAKVRLAAQRRRLLVLERQLEGAGIEPAVELPSTRSSWLDRLFGGLSVSAP